jgi:hypothetical protein
MAPASERVRIAWQRRNESDYVFSFWTALGWTLLTCGIWGIYGFYQLMRRMRDHNLRRIELLDAATTFAWEQAQAKGMQAQLEPSFQRINGHMATLRAMTTDFRDPIIWTVLSVIGGGIVHAIAAIFLDGDLVKHDQAEGAIEAELSETYRALGASIAPPDPGRMKGKHNYVGRIIAAVASCGIYGFWWMYNLMDEPNRHFEHNWRWEDDLSGAVQSLI